MSRVSAPFTAGLLFCAKENQQMKIAASVFAGFLFGIMVSRAPSVIAQSPATAGLFINAVWVDDPKLPVAKAISGEHIKGISCIPKPLPKLPDAAVCYVATQNE
jgi:hypothetical protein